MSSKHAWKVDFIPWDFKSPEHAVRLREQRVACGWGTESVPIHKKSCADGRLVLYWIVLSDEVQNRDTLISNHVAKYPEEATPITDTANEVRLAARVPTEKAFMPIGHIGISIHSPDDDEKLSLPRTGVVWLQALYISFAIQRGGFGVGSVEKLEQLARGDPYNASIIGVDTAAKESHRNEIILIDEYDRRGLPRPLQSNEEWYERLGFELFARKDDGYNHLLENGEIFTLKSVFLKKSLVISLH